MLRESSWWPVLLLTACLHLADPQIHLYIPAHREPDSESGYSNRQGSCSYGGDDRCTFVLLCLLSGGTSAGRCGNSLLYTCCLRPSTRSSLPADHAPATQLVHARSPPATGSSSASSSAAARATQRKYYPVDEDDSETRKPCVGLHLDLFNCARENMQRRRR